MEYNNKLEKSTVGQGSLLKPMQQFDQSRLAVFLADCNALSRAGQDLEVGRCLQDAVQ